MNRTLVIDQVTRQLKFFTADAIRAFVLAGVDEPLILQTGEESLDSFHMARLSRADEVIIGNIEGFPIR